MACCYDPFPNWSGKSFDHAALTVSLSDVVCLELGVDVTGEYDKKVPRPI